MDGGSVSRTAAATVPPHAWLVARIAGDAITVETVLPPDADPHTFQLDDAQVSRLARSRILFRTGVPLERGAWLDALASAGGEVVDLRAGLDLLDEGTDPHVWTSPRRLMVQARSVAEALGRAFPADASGFEERTEVLIAELQDLDLELSERLARFEGRAFFVHHPSWGYFAADYGLEQVAVEHGGHAPTDAELTAIQRRAREAGARSLFVSPRESGREARILAESLGMDLRMLDPLAAEVPTHLRHVADELIASWESSGALAH